MNNLISLATAVLTSLVVSTLVLAVILSPLRRVIGMLCRSPDANPFWTAFTILMLYAVPLLFALWWTPTYPDSYLVMRGALAATLFGLIGGLSIIGFKVASNRPA